VPGPLFGKIVSGLLQANLASSAALDAIQHLIDTWALRQPAQLTGKELLQRLTAPLSPALKSGVHILGNVTDQQVRHAYIMLSFALSCKAAKDAQTTQSDCLPCRRARIPANRRGFAIEVELTGDGTDLDDLFAARTAAGARRPAGPETPGGLALRIWVRGSCGWSGCRC